MNQQFFQVNPAISIQDYTEKKTLVFGQIKNVFSVSEDYDNLKSLCRHLIEVGPFSKDQFEIVSGGLNYKAADLFDDLRSLNVLIPYYSKSERFSRHKNYYSFVGASPEAQLQIQQKAVLLIGVGGIGSTCATLLNAAGIGRLFLVDADRVEESNLTRTTLFNEEDVGGLKVKAARHHLNLKNKSAQVIDIPLMLSSSNEALVAPYFKEADFIILSGDSGSEVHRLTYALAKKFNKPLMNAGYVETYGVLGPTTIGESFFREAELGAVAVGSEINIGVQAPSFGPLNSLISSMAVNEVLRYLLELPVRSLNKRILIDSTDYSLQEEDCL